MAKKRLGHLDKREERMKVRKLMVESTDHFVQGALRAEGNIAVDAEPAKIS